MNFYIDACRINSIRTIRVHPLLLSLSTIVEGSDANPDISTISENDKRVLESEFYTSPSALPPLEIHFSGQNGASLPINKNAHALTSQSVAGCRECIAFSSQDNLGSDGNAIESNSAAKSNALETKLAHIGSAPLSTRNKAKRHRRTSSGSVQGGLSNTRGQKAARVIRRSKGKLVQEADLLGVNPSHPEEKPDASSGEGRDWEAVPCMFSGIFLLACADGIRCSLKLPTVI